MKPVMITVKKASEILSCSEKTVRRLVDDGRIQGCKIRRCLRILANSLDDYVRAQILEFQTRDGLDEKI